MYGSADNSPVPIIYSDVAAEQALDMGVYVIHFGVYPGHLHSPMLIVNFQVRYLGLCYVMYVYACYDTYQLIPDRFTRVNALCVFKP